MSRVYAIQKERQRQAKQKKDIEYEKPPVMHAF